MRTIQKDGRLIRVYRDERLLSTERYVCYADGTGTFQALQNVANIHPYSLTTIEVYIDRRRTKMRCRQFRELIAVPDQEMEKRQSLLPRGIQIDHDGPAGSM